MKKEDEKMDLQKQLLNEYTITIHSYPDNTIENIPEFLKKIDNITSQKEDSTIQLLDCDYICGIKHLNQAIAQSIKAFQEKQNFAHDRGLEICVRLSAQKQITQALNLLGIKKQGNITVVYINTTDKQIMEVETFLSNRRDELLEEYDSKKIVEKYELVNDENIEDTLCEKIALLSIKN